MGTPLRSGYSDDTLDYLSPSQTATVDSASHGM